MGKNNPQKISDNLDKDFLIRVAAGEVQGYKIINKFGFNGDVGTSFVPATSSGTYQTPIDDTEIEIVSNSVNDVSGGTGIITVKVEGINLAGEELSKIVTLTGLTAVTLPVPYFRVFRITAMTSGTYAGATAPSHNSTIIVRTKATPANIWGIISTEDTFGLGQSQIGAYTIPAGYTASLISASAIIDASKPVSIYLFRRDNADTVVAPYGVMRLMQESHGAAGVINLTPRAPINGIQAFTDLGVMVKADQAATITVTMQILLKKI